MNLADALNSKTYKDGDCIIKQVIIHILFNVHFYN